MPAAVSPQTIVVQWVEAFNARDLQGMLACVAGEVELHPLRMGGVSPRYRGHDGVREWFERFCQARLECAITLDRVTESDEGRVFASGSLGVDERVDLAPFWALHRIEWGLIVDARHYLTEPGMLAQLGLTEVATGRLKGGDPW